MGVCVSKVQFGANGLEYTRGNEVLLSALADQVDSLVKTHPKEAAVRFQRPLAWKTKLRLEQIGLTSPSEEKCKDGTPCFSLSNGTVSVSTMAYLSQVLKAAGDQRVAELKRGLEANREPLSNILGQAYGQGADLLDIHERVTSKENSDEDSQFFRLLLLLQAIDTKLLRDSVEHLSQDTRLNMQAAEAEVELLKSVAGIEDHNCLLSIDWESSYTFSNGLRAPPWRQVHGDLGYIVIKPVDADRLYVLANVNGFWQITGPDAEGKMDDTRHGEAYSALSALLRIKSPHFADNIDKQELHYRAQDSTGAAVRHDNLAATQAEMRRYLDSDDTTATIAASGSATDGAASTTRRTGASAGATSASAARQSSASSSSRRALQPSQKWASLGLGGGPAASSSGAATVTRPTRGTASKGSSARRAGTGTSGASRMDTATSFLPRRTARAARGEEFEESSEEEEEEDVEERRVQAADLPPEYWSIHKLVKYLSGGNQTATVIALCSLRDFDLTSESCQFAVRDVGGLDVLINLLDTEDVKCKVGALQILTDISLNVHAKRAIADMNGMRPLVGLLEAEDDRLQGLAALTIANCAKYPRNRRMVRFYGGIEKAVALLRAGVEDANEEVARCGATALWSCSKSSKNKQRILNAGAVPLLASLLRSDNIELLVPVVGVLEECASDPTYRDLIRQKRMVPYLVANLSKDNKTLQAHSAMAIFKCAEDTATRQLVRECGGLEPLVRLLRNVDDTALLEGVSGAIWKCSLDEANIKAFSDLKAVEFLVALLGSSSEAVLTNVAGALSELTKNQESCRLLRTSGGIEPLVNLLSGTNASLLINVTRAVGVAARLKDNIDAIDKLDGVRLLWSLLKSNNATVQADAAWAICPCIENARDAGEMVRSFVGGLELVVGLLRSEDNEILASVCAAISYIAKDEENLAVITDHGVVPMLSQLARTSNDKLRCNLAQAMANCCVWGNNRVAFGKEGAVAPLSKYLKSKDAAVHRATARALFELSKDPNNCVTMHRAGVVQPLLDLVGSTDRTTQDAAAGCLANIRRLALVNEMQRFG